MAAYRQVYDSRHLQADYQKPGSAPEPYFRQSSIGYLYFFYFWLFTLSQKKTICNPLYHPTWKCITLTCEVPNFFLSDWRFALYLHFPYLRFPSLRNALFRTCLFHPCVFQYLRFQRPRRFHLLLSCMVSTLQHGNDSARDCGVLTLCSCRVEWAPERVVITVHSSRTYVY